MTRVWFVHLPGLCLSALIALIAICVQGMVSMALLSPLMLSTLVGIAVRCAVGPIAIAAPGIVFATKRLTRAAIVLLGTQITIGQVWGMGIRGVLLVAGVLVTTFLVTKRIGALLGVDPRLAELVAAGTAICGASAIVATNAVTEGTDEDVASAITCVTVFGCLGAILYPHFGDLLALDTRRYGLWAGASLHELAQVVAATIPKGSEAASLATVAKLLRVAMLAPLVLALAYSAKAVREETDGVTPVSRAPRPPVPWFAVGLLGVIIVNSTGLIPAGFSNATHVLVMGLLGTSLAAMGLSIHPERIVGQGLSAVLLTALASVFISVLSLGLIAYVC